VAGLDGHVLAPQLAQVVAALADGVAGLSAEPADCGGEFGGGEPVGGGGQGERGREGGADAGLVQVDAAGADGTDPGRQRQLVQQAVGDKADVGAVQRGGEPGRRCRPGG